MSVDPAVRVRQLEDECELLRADLELRRDTVKMGLANVEAWGKRAKEAEAERDRLRVKVNALTQATLDALRALDACRAPLNDCRDRLNAARYHALASVPSVPEGDE